jgi:hypothetical protein
MTDVKEKHAEALSRIGQTSDGEHLLKLLYERLNRVAPRGSESGALQELNGERSFALEIIRALEKNYAGPADRHVNTARGTTAEPSGTGRRSRRRRFQSPGESAG